jgi:hypothetical protein
MVDDSLSASEPIDPGFFSRLVTTQVLSEYEIPILFLAADPEATSPDWRHWLINWRRGGPLAARGEIPAELSGVESWLAFPISEKRRQQIVEERVSLRETILLAERQLYILEGPDPQQPRTVRSVQPFDLTPELLPTAEVSVFGTALPFPVDLREQETIQVRVHVVPGGDSPDHPTWAVSAALQECFSRYVSRAARAFFGSTSTGGGPVERIIPVADWAGMSLVHASPGSLVLVGESGAASHQQLESIGSALKKLKSITEGSFDRSSAKALESEIGREGVASLFALADLIHQLDVSMTLRWRSGPSEDFAAIGDAVAKRVYSRLGDYLAARTLEYAAQTPMIVVQLADSDATALRRPVDPQAGGHQALIAALQDQLDSQNVLRIRSDQVEKVVRYVQDYGQGGFQDRLRPIYFAVYQMGLSFVGLR